MPALTIESAVYSFEGLLPELESPPIAARRALDHAGYRLSVEGWRSLSIEERERLTLAGVPDRVDVEMVAGTLRRANPSAQKITPASDPDPSTPPEALVKALEPHRSIEPKRWVRLRGIDRYALAHTYRRAVARSAFSILGDALDAVLLAAAPAAYDPPAQGRQGFSLGETPKPPPQAYSMGETPKPPQHASPSVPPPSYDPSSRGGYAMGDIPRAPPPFSMGEPAKTPPQGPQGGNYQPAGFYSSFVPPAPPASDAQKTPTTPRGAVQPGAISNHLNQAGEVHMVDVARKPKTERRAIARGSVRMKADTLSRLQNRDAPKGEVLATARLAGILAAKRTHEVIPLCHAVALTHLEVVIDLDPAGSAVHVTAIADAYDRTGCEMEAMVAVSTACLTVYDMLKGLDREMVITDVKLVEKSGGRSGHYRRAESKP